MSEVDLVDVRDVHRDCIPPGHCAFTGRVPCEAIQLADEIERLRTREYAHGVAMQLAEQEIERLRADHQRVTDLVNAQAEDDGLWFEAKTAPEAYLQQELRRLHETCETRASLRAYDSGGPQWDGGGGGRWVRR